MTGLETARARNGCQDQQIAAQTIAAPSITTGHPSLDFLWDSLKTCPPRVVKENRKPLLGRLTPLLPHKPGSGWQKDRHLARPGAPGLGAWGSHRAGGARSQVPWGPRAAFLQGLQRPPLKGAEEQLGTRTKRPGPPRRKEAASPRKQLIALSSACFFLCSTVLLPRQTKDVRSDSLPCLDCAADWVGFVRSWERGPRRLLAAFPEDGRTVCRACPQPRRLAAPGGHCS